MDYSEWPWKVIIPSYNRIDYLKTHSFALCKKFKIPDDKIFIFVATHEEEDYKKAFNEYTVRIIPGPIGLKNMRNFITGFFKEDEALLCMDDDIGHLYSLYEDKLILDTNKASHWKLKEIKPVEFFEFTIDAYKQMIEQKKYLFGIYPVKNGFFMKDLPSITYNSRFCVGTFWGIINRQSCLEITMDEKEDMERSILCAILDSGVLRYNHITLSTKYYKTPGGMQTETSYEKRIQNSIESAKKLVEKYPHMCKIYSGKKNGMCEVRFIKGI